VRLDTLTWVSRVYGPEEDRKRDLKPFFSLIACKPFSSFNKSLIRMVL
jgi:hypothetical protein